MSKNIISKKSSKSFRELGPCNCLTKNDMFTTRRTESPRTECICRAARCRVAGEILTGVSDGFCVFARPPTFLQLDLGSCEHVRLSLGSNAVVASGWFSNTDDVRTFDIFGTDNLRIDDETFQDWGAFVAFRIAIPNLTDLTIGERAFAGSVQLRDFGLFSPIQ